MGTVDSRSIDANIVLRTLFETTAAETGQRCFEALVQGLCRARDVHGAGVTRYLPDKRRLRAIAFWIDGRFVSDYEYDVAGTPCEPVVSRGCLVNFAEDVILKFPADPDLRAFSAVSYMGTPL